MTQNDHLQTLSRSLFLVAFAGNFRISQWQVDRLAPTMEEHVWSAGSTLFREGDAPDYVHFMEDGELELTRGGVVPVLMKGKWLVGALESSMRIPRTRTGTLLRETKVVSAPSSAWAQLFEDDFLMVRNAFLGTAGALVQLYARITDEQLVLDHRVGRLDVLPDEPLDLVERLLSLTVPTATHFAGVQALTTLAESAEELRCPNATALGADPGLRAHLLLSGDVIGRRVGHLGTVRVMPGGFIPHALLHEPRSWTLDGEGPVRTLAFRPETMMDELEEHPDLVRAVLTAQWKEREWILSNLFAPEGRIVML